MINPAVTSGVDIFVYIVVVLIAFATAVSLIDWRKTSKKKFED